MQPPTASIPRRIGGWFPRTSIICIPSRVQLRRAQPRRQLLTSHGRGIPAGYVNALEKRLAETEKALFSALAEARAGAHSNATSRPTLRPSVLSRSTPTTQQEKAELMTIWSKTPLQDGAHVDAWFEANREQGASPIDIDFGQTRAVRELDAVTPVTPPTEGPANFGSLTAQTHHNGQTGGSIPALADDGQSRHSGSPRLGMRAQRVPRVSRHSPLSRGSTTPGPSLLQASRANRFASDNKRLYF